MKKIIDFLTSPLTLFILGLVELFFCIGAFMHLLFSFSFCPLSFALGIGSLSVIYAFAFSLLDVRVKMLKRKNKKPSDQEDLPNE